MIQRLEQEIAIVKRMMGSVKSKHLSVFLLTSVIMFDTCVKLSSSQLQQYVHFLPINNWNCSDEMEKICAVDTATEMMNTSSLTECTMQCMMNRDQCLQFNYYHSISPKCALYNFRPKNYINSTDCQHYAVRACVIKYQHFVYTSFDEGCTPTAITSFNEKKIKLNNFCSQLRSKVIKSAHF